MLGSIKENISYKYFFSPAEREDNARKLADAQIGKMELEDEKKAVTSEYKAKIDGKDSEIKLISRHIIDGYTTKTKYALKQKNYTQKVWEWVDEDTGEVVKTEPLSPKDMQQDIPFPTPAPAPTPEPPAGSTVQPSAPGLPSLEALLNMDQPPLPVLEAVVTPEVEDLNNGSELVDTSTQSARFIGLPGPRQLPQGPAEAPEGPGDGGEADDRNEGADFDADTFVPDEPPTRPVKPKKPGQAAKSTRATKSTRSDRPAQPAGKDPKRPRKK
jgi:hypothetical protein